MNVDERYQSSIQYVVDTLKREPDVLLILLAGSAHYGFFADDSNINFIVVVGDGKKDMTSYSCFYQDIVINIDVFERSEYLHNITLQEGEIDVNAYIINTEVLYAADPILANMKEEYAVLGEDASEIHIFFDLVEIILYMHIIKKWLDVKQDIHYAKYNFLMVSSLIAKIEYLKNKTVLAKDRVALAKKFNPEMMNRFYEDALDSSWSLDKCYALLTVLDSYVEENILAYHRVITKLFAVKQQEVLTVSDIAKYYGIYAPFVNIGCQYLCDKKILGHSTEQVPFLKKGKVKVEESIYYLIRG